MQKMAVLFLRLEKEAMAAREKKVSITWQHLYRARLRDLLSQIGPKDRVRGVEKLKFSR